MAIQLLEVSVASVTVDDTRAPDHDTSQVFDHLLRYCSKFDPLPAITIRIEGGAATVVRGHKYLLAARSLGRRVIRAVVAGAPTPEHVNSLVASADAKILDWEEIKAAEAREPIPLGWHVFFFARPLAREEKAAFDAVVTSLFSDACIRVTHDDAGPLAEFEARTPVTDTAWAARHLDAFTAFSRNRVAIVTYQGRRFGFGGAVGASSVAR